MIAGNRLTSSSSELHGFPRPEQPEYPEVRPATVRETGRDAASRDGWTAGKTAKGANGPGTGMRWASESGARTQLGSFNYVEKTIMESNRKKGPAFRAI